MLCAIVLYRPDEDGCVMSGPSMDDLRAAGVDARMRHLQERLDQIVAGLPWWRRLGYRASLAATRRRGGKR